MHAITELTAANKAAWLACKVKETLGHSGIKLTLKVDAQWLCYANAVRQRKEGGGRARALRDLAIRSGVLTVEHIAGDKNPVDKYTIFAGFKKIDAPSACRGAMTLHRLV